MAHVVIYRTTYCPYCDMAKRMFQDLGVKFEEIDVTHDPDVRDALVARTGGRRTVPQIFIDDVAVGGYTDVRQLHTEGRLMPMLAKS